MAERSQQSTGEHAKKTHFNGQLTLDSRQNEHLSCTIFSPHWYKLSMNPMALNGVNRLQGRWQKTRNFYMKLPSCM